MPRVFQRGPARLRANLTPMIDVVFLLIIFFVLVAHFSVTGRAPMNLPKLDAGQPLRLSGDRPAVIDILSTPQGASSISLHGQRFDLTDQGLSALAQTLRAIRLQTPEIPVIVRAAADESSVNVQRVLRACRSAGAGSVRVASQKREVSP